MRSHRVRSSGVTDSSTLRSKNHINWSPACSSSGQTPTVRSARSLTSVNRRQRIQEAPRMVT